MKKMWVVALMLYLIITLAGCKKQAVYSAFTVNDEIPANEMGFTPEYTITFAMPENFVQQAVQADNSKALYESPDGNCSILTQIVPKENVNTVIKNMTGYDRSKLLVLQTERFSMPEYRFSWSTGGENGLLLCYGVVLADEDYCYTIQFSSGENLEDECAEIRENVLSTFGLYAADGF